VAYREARPFFYICILLAVLAWWLVPVLTFLPILAAAYVLYFFRDPFRFISTDPLDIVSPADGKVISVIEEEERWFSKEKRKRVAIFLSVFDVHVNRSPVDAEVKQIIYEKGKFLDARDPEVDVQNEHQTWLLTGPRGAVVVRQIAGLIARRIVRWKEEGDAITKGQRIGMIRFGSRTDLYLPVDCKVLVEPGQRVKGGSTVLARWPENPS
jgi:phosphatidylserine decarboxylase